jgi:GntR family transcriptional regulator
MDGAIPRYLWVYNSLKSQLEAEDYRVGEYLPAEPELQKNFRVSRTTVRKAMEMLSAQGFVHSKQGKGTQVLNFRATQKLGYVTSFSETLREKGFRVTQADLKVDFVIAPQHVAVDLSIKPGSRIVKIERTVVANAAPIGLMTNYLLPELAHGIKKRIAGMKSLYLFLESEYNVVINAATNFIMARKASPEEARKLRVSKNSPLLVVRRITYSEGKPIEVSLLLAVAEKYEYCVHTKGRPPQTTGRRKSSF